MTLTQLWQTELRFGVHKVYLWNGLDGMSYGRMAESNLMMAESNLHAQFILHGQRS